MAIFFGHSTALAFWRSGVSPSSLPASRLVPGDAPPSKKEVFEAAASLATTMSRASRVTGGSLCHLQEELPLDIMVGSACARRNAKEIRCHVQNSTMPKRSYLKVANGCYVARPEACFLQLARGLSFEKLLMIGMELCGTYAPNALAEKKFVSRGWGQNPTTPARIARYIDTSCGTKGVERARIAARHLAQGAASPAEAKTYLLLCLPYRYGGYGIAKPLLNPRLHVKGKTYEFISEEKYVPAKEVKRPDFLWAKRKFALEYDSLEHHSEVHEMARDSERRGELEFADIHVVTLTGTQLYDQQRFEKVARAVAKQTGKRLNRVPANWDERRWALRQAILPL